MQEDEQEAHLEIRYEKNFHTNQQDDRVEK